MATLLLGSHGLQKQKRPASSGRGGGIRLLIRLGIHRAYQPNECRIWLNMDDRPSARRPSL